MDAYNYNAITLLLVFAYPAIIALLFWITKKAMIWTITASRKKRS